MGKDPEMVDLEKPKLKPNPTYSEARSKPNDHGYPAGFAQLVHSPETFVLEPMQIDTHNREWSPSLTNQSGHKEWFLPKSVAGKWDKLGGLNPLIECPCSDRIERLSGNDGKGMLRYTAPGGKQTTQPYDVSCGQQPRSDMAAQHNPACNVETY